MLNKSSVVTLGTFDGVHLGHQKILRQVINRARKLRLKSVVMAFDMPPRHSRSPQLHPMLLTTLNDKLQILKRLGIDHTEVLIFDRTTASTPPDRFFQKRILKKNKAKEMVVGPRLAFGKNRTGNLPLLMQLGKHYGVKIHVISGVNVDRIPVSSSRIRAFLYRGDVEAARRQLGYFYSVSGKVIHGSHRGHRLGFPTANIAVDKLKILPPGVFWIKCLSTNKAFPLQPTDLRSAVDGVCNIGTRPTFTANAETVHCEAFLFAKPPKLYGKDLRIVFMKRIRPEKRFKSPQALIQQIARDVQKAKALSDS